MGMGKSGIALLLCFALLGNVLAGSLGDFEDAVAKPVPPSEKKHSRNRDYDDCDDGGGSSFVGYVALGLVYGTYRGVKWVAYDWWAEPDEEPVPVVDSPGDAADADGGFADEDYEEEGLDGLRHVIGTPSIPYARFDYRWQYLDHDTDAHDFLLEAGYKYLAFYGRVTQYEAAADENLDIEQFYGMLRIGGTDDFYFPGSFQIGAGLGVYSIQGDQTQSGAALTIPVMLYPTEWLGFEFRPAWTTINDKTVSDYDVSVGMGYRFAHLRLGYRWLWVQHEGHWLDGPYAGVSVSF